MAGNGIIVAGIFGPLLIWGFCYKGSRKVRWFSNLIWEFICWVFSFVFFGWRWVGSTAIVIVQVWVFVTYSSSSVFKEDLKPDLAMMSGIMALICYLAETTIRVCYRYPNGWKSQDTEEETRSAEWLAIAGFVCTLVCIAFDLWIFGQAGWSGLGNILALGASILGAIWAIVCYYVGKVKRA